MSLGYIGSGETALVFRPARGAPLWGFCVLEFDWEVVAVFFVVVGVSRLSSRSQGGVLVTDIHEVFFCGVELLHFVVDHSGYETFGGGIIAWILDFGVWLEGGCLFCGGG